MPDPRRRRGVRYLLAVAVCAVLVGVSTFAATADMAADLDPPAPAPLGLVGRVRLPAPCGAPGPPDATVLQAVLTNWLRAGYRPHRRYPGVQTGW